MSNPVLIHCLCTLRPPLTLGPLWITRLWTSLHETLCRQVFLSLGDMPSSGQRSTYKILTNAWGVIKVAPLFFTPFNEFRFLHTSYSPFCSAALLAGEVVCSISVLHPAGWRGAPQWLAEHLPVCSLAICVSPLDKVFLLLLCMYTCMLCVWVGLGWHPLPSSIAP